MKCPYCAHLGDKVVTRARAARASHPPRRECLAAGSASRATSASTKFPTWSSKRRHAGTVRTAEARHRAAESLREAPGERFGARGDCRSCGEARCRSAPRRKSPRTRSVRSSWRSSEARQGGVRAVRVRVPQFSRHGRVHDRAERSVERQRMKGHAPIRG